jgi:hypothetical protein
LSDDPAKDQTDTFCYLTIRHAHHRGSTIYIRLVLEAKYEEGWFDAQGCHRDAKCVFGGFDYIEFGVIGAIVIGSFAIVRLGRPKIGNGLAMAVALLTAVLWIGMTR